MKLKKSIWTESDYKVMGWHDSTVHGMAIFGDAENYTSELVLDIDYIFQWVTPNPPDKHFTFWITPCTLVFNDVFDLKINFETGLIYPIEMEIADLVRLDTVELPNGSLTNEWKIEISMVGEIAFKATGYTQYVRMQPIHQASQELSLAIRKGISFERTSC